MTLLAKEVGIIKDCANPKCTVQFNPTRHNQIYCGRDCRKVVTNANSMGQYYEKRDRKLGKKRMCKSCGTTPLSRYNEGNTCQSCQLKARSVARQELLLLVGAS